MDQEGIAPPSACGDAQRLNETSLAPNQPIVSKFIHPMPIESGHDEPIVNIMRTINDSCVTNFKGNHISTNIIANSANQLGPILLLDGQQQQSQAMRTSRQSSIIEILLSAFIQGGRDDGKVTCLSTYLLGAALIASVLNIILLSFVVKSVQLNDGFIDGKISWDEQMESTIFRLATRLLEGKSISMKSIGSLSDGPIKVETTCSTTGRQKGALERHDHAQSPDDIGDGCPILLSRLQPDSKLATKNQTKFSYTAANVIDGGRRSSSGAKLEIETELLVWDLINRFGVSTNRTKNLTPPPVTGPIMETNGRQQSSSRRLLEFDNEHELISLPLEDKLNLESIMATSVIVNGELESSEITGSLEENLDIQTRNGNLACDSVDSMKFVSKSAVARLSAFEDLVLSAPSLTLCAGKHFYLPDGIRYFDLEPSAAPSNMDTHMTQSAVKGANSMATTGDSHQHLKAYNLVAINGQLMASTA